MPAGHGRDNDDQNIRAGLDYWKAAPASIDGALGGFGNGPLPRVDALGSRQFLLGLMPSLCTVPSALRRLEQWPPLTRRIRALDVGAGIGRVTQTVLLQLVHDIVLLEPISKFIAEAQRLAPSWRGIADASKSVTFIQGTLQTYDPSSPYTIIPSTRVPGVTSPSSIEVLGRAGYIPPGQQEEQGFDVLWCQWCLGHLSDTDLVAFLKKCKASLCKKERPPSPCAFEHPGVVVVKENICPDASDGGPNSMWDEADSSLTRSDRAWHAIFREAGLRIVRQQQQLGLHPGLYRVNMYALR